MPLSGMITDELLHQAGNPKAALERLVFRAISADPKMLDDYLIAEFFDFDHQVHGLDEVLTPDERRLLWDAIGTHRRRLAHLARIVRPQPREFIVDVGCGLGGLAFHLASAGARVFGMDRDAPTVAHGRHLMTRLGGQVTLAVGDCRSLPLPADSVDKIVCSLVFEHLVEKQVTLGEFRRVLKGDGRLFIYTDNLTHVLMRVWARRFQRLLTSGHLRSWGVGYSGEEGGHVALITPSAMSKILREAGFSVRIVYSLPTIPVLGRLVSRFFCAVAQKPLGQRGVA